MTTSVLSRDSLQAVLSELVAIPSVNPDLSPEEPGGEAAIAEFCRGWLEARGVRAWLEEVAPGRPNVVAEVGAGAGPTLVLCAHLDTVSTQGMSIPPLEPRVEGARLYGRGSFDMKGGIASILCAAAALAEEPPAGRVLLALVCDEENASIGADDFVRRHRAHGCIVTEPSAGQLVVAHKGFVWAEIVTAGIAAHGSRWDLGVSAVGRMGRIIAQLERFDAQVLRRKVDPLVGPASLHCALISGGTAWSTYAAACTLRVERRTLPGERLEDVLAELKSVVQQAGEGAEVRLVFHRPPMVCDRDEPVAAALRAAITDVAGSPPVEAGVQYWMDAAVFAAAGIPAVDFGGTGEGAHAAVEWTDVDSWVTTARVLVQAARRFCGTGA